MITATSPLVPDLITLDQALELDSAQNLALHRRHLNPRIAALFEIIGAETPLTRAEGCHVWDARGVRYLDFLSGFAALNLGHNHPAIDGALERTRDCCNLVEGLSPAAAALAHNLAVLSPGRGLDRVFFANSGAEAIDASLKLARAATGRSRIVACERGFHGRTMAALSINSTRAFREKFEPLVPHTSFVPYGDADALEQALKQRDVAGFVVEPVQGEAGMVVPPPGYLRQARALCSRYGSLLIADEVQTGLGRTGRLFAVEHDDIVPDALVLGKALGGGVMPISAVLTSEEHWKAAHGGTPRSPFQTPTFGGNTRACVAALATLEVLLQGGLIPHAAGLGELLLTRLRELQAKHPLMAEVSGRGLMAGIRFAAPAGGVISSMTGGVLQRLSHDFIAGLFVLELRQTHRILTLSTLNDPTVLRAQPPLVCTHGHVEEFVRALDQTLTEFRDSLSAGLLKHWHLLVRALTV
ncbi:MAG TPA: aspartate aminotransferase family protein [Vicinamibacterales bacterium]